MTVIIWDFLGWSRSWFFGYLCWFQSFAQLLKANKNLSWGGCRFARWRWVYYATLLSESRSNIDVKLVNSFASVKSVVNDCINKTWSASNSFIRRSIQSLIIEICQRQFIELNLISFKYLFLSWLISKLTSFTISFVMKVRRLPSDGLFPDSNSIFLIWLFQSLASSKRDWTLMTFTKALNFKV